MPAKNYPSYLLSWLYLVILALHSTGGSAFECKSFFLAEPIVVTGWSEELDSKLQTQHPFTHAALTNFLKISKFPRGSGHEASLRDAIQAAAKEFGFETILDGGNLWVNVPGRGKFKDSKKSIALQAHLDMVLAHANTVPSADGKSTNLVELFKNGLPSLSYADGVFQALNNAHSIGADNGTGVAIMLAIMQGALEEHPPMELLFTVEEETGLIGAMRLKRKFLSAQLINLDAEKSAEHFVASQSSQRAKFTAQLESSKLVAVPPNFTTFDIDVRGWRGGHSAYISNGASGTLELKKLLVKILQKFPDSILTSALSGKSDILNEIPSSFSLRISLSSTEANSLLLFLHEYINETNRIFVGNNFDQPATMKVKMTPELSPLSGFISEYLINTLERLSLVSGRLSGENYLPLAGFAEDLHASNNVGYFSVSAEQISLAFGIMPRSAESDAVKIIMADTLDKAQQVFRDIEFQGGPLTPSWKAKRNSNLENHLLQAAQDIGLKITPIKALGGIEPAPIAVENPDLEIISIGAGARNCHTVREGLCLSDFTLGTNLVVKTIENISRSEGF